MEFINVGGHFTSLHFDHHQRYGMKWSLKTGTSQSDSARFLTIDSTKDLRVEGSKLSGSVQLNPSLAKEKGATSVSVALKALVKTWIQVDTGQGSYRTIESQVLFKIEHVIWDTETSIPDHPYETISLPWSFTIPTVDDRDENLPSSLHCGNSHHGGKIQYYIHAVADRPGWYKRNTRVNAPFPFLPIDKTPAPTLQLDEWTGSWTKLQKSINVRSNALMVFGPSGSVDVSLQLPKVDSFPLFTRIPCRIKITCSSKQLPSTSSLDPNTFTFPRAPKMSDIELELSQHCRIRARGHRRTFNEKLGLLGGFGTLDHLENILSERSEPVWDMDEEKEDKGRWTESVTYTAQLILRCPTPTDTKLIQTEINILAKVNFPGIGNTWKTKLGPLPISSGITSAEQLNVNQELRTQLDFAVPPSYWDVMEDDGDRDKDEKEK